MTMIPPTYPFEVPLKDLLRDPDQYVDAVFSSLESEFLIMPKGAGFVEYPAFENAYEALKKATEGFRRLETSKVCEAFASQPLVVIVLRTMLGMTPPEWAYLATLHTGTPIPQGFVRTIDRRLRMAPGKLPHFAGLSGQRMTALIETACTMLTDGAPETAPGELHRLSKADTVHGGTSTAQVADMGIPYAMLLYERLLGRPFAGHRDSVSELIGGGLETAVEDVLQKAGVSYRKTQRAERVDGFDQAPDFVVPSEYNPKVVIEAKITEDDGTARDKVTRIQHLGELSRPVHPDGEPKFEVIACIGGRGFSVRREDMKKMLLATRGKVFTAKTLDRMIQNTALHSFATR